MPRNSIYVSFNQDKDLREAIARTGVKILGAKGDSAYFIGGEDAATRATDGSATAGRNYRLQGKNIKVTGTDPAVGIVLIDEKGAETKLPMDMIAVNNPSEVLVLLPADLKDGIYKLRLTTQYTSGNRQLKTPHVISQTIVIGNTTEGAEILWTTRQHKSYRIASLMQGCIDILCSSAQGAGAPLHNAAMLPGLQSLIDLYRKFSP